MIKSVFGCILGMISTLCASGTFAAGPALGVFKQKIDHSRNAVNTGTFPQRYWVNDDFGTNQDAPVLLRICGEGACEDHIHQDDIYGFAKALGARVVYLEHRFYGKSQPFADLSTESLRYLTLDNVIEDIAEFERFYFKQNQLTGKWIAIGTSYSGTLAAIYRHRHPELVVGALASSSPMAARALSSDSSQRDQIVSEEPSFYGYLAPRQWAYQACTEIGFWGAIGKTLFVPGRALCEGIFGIGTRVDLDKYNQKYFLPFVSPGVNSASNILFTNGTEDPWAAIGINEHNNRNPRIHTYLIEGGGHHDDLNRGELTPMSNASLKARSLFIRLAEKWLKE